MTTVSTAEVENTMWRQLGARLLDVLEKLYPETTDAQLIAASSMDSLAMAENNLALPLEGRKALTKYLDDLPYYRAGNVEAALCQHQYRSMQLPAFKARRPGL